MPSADFLGTSEPAFDNLFLVYFTALPGLTPLYVQSMALPNMAWTEVQSNYFIAQRKFASSGTVENLSMSIKDFVTVDSAAAVYAWWLSVGNLSSGVLNPPASYKSSGVIILTDGRGNPLNTWTATGCWPQSVRYGQLQQGSGAMINIEITVAVDRIDLG